MAYREVWRLPDAPALLLIGVVARLGIGMTPIALLLLVERDTGRYATGGAAVACYALSGAVANPLIARLADRIGAARVLICSSALHALALGALTQVTGPWVFPLAAVAGAGYPPLTGSIRGAWVALTAADHPARTAALAAETSLFELVHLAGPLLVAGLTWLTGGFAAALGLAAVVTVAGAAALARLPALRVAADPVERGRGVLRAPGFGTLLCCVALLGAGFGLVTVGVPAFVGEPAAGALLLGVWCVGSTLGGYWFGTRTVDTDHARLYGVLLLLVALGFSVCALMPGPVSLGFALALGSVAVAPALTMENGLVARIAPAGTGTEAYTWVSTVAVTSSAAGSAAAGLIVDRPGGVPWAFVLASASVAVAGGLAAVPRGALSRAVSPLGALTG